MSRFNFAQAILDCSTSSVTAGIKQASITKADLVAGAGCAGNFPPWAMEKIIELGGLPLEEHYPFSGLDGSCR